MEHTKRRNLNRGYMKLEVWQCGLELFAGALRLSEKVPDLKLRSQLRDAAQSVSANIAEGGGRRSLPEYLQFLYPAKGPLAETLTRMIGLKSVQLVSEEACEDFDQLHSEVENKLLGLIASPEQKCARQDWCDALPPRVDAHPPIRRPIKQVDSP